MLIQEPRLEGFFYTNCDCLTQTKLSELQCFIRTNSPDVVALTEIRPKTPYLKPQLTAI